MSIDFSKKNRIVVKVGSSTITHPQTGGLNYDKLDKLVRMLCDIKNMGKDVCLVTSGAIAVGRGVLGLTEKPSSISAKQACASIGQASLMSVYQKLFGEYNQTIGQILMTKNTMTNEVSRNNAENTFKELFALGAIPIVNENDTVSTYEMQFGDNDTLSAIVASLVGADTLILMSDIDGLYTANPREDANAMLIPLVLKVDDSIIKMASSDTGSGVGTGGMATKIKAAQIASAAGTDMIICNGEDVENLSRIFKNESVGTIFLSNKDDEFSLIDILGENA